MNKREPPQWAVGCDAAGFIVVCVIQQIFNRLWRHAAAFTGFKKKMQIIDILQCEFYSFWLHCRLPFVIKHYSLT